MSTLALSPVGEQFFQEVASHPQSALLLDYDGTVAPFTRDRAHASPYPRIPELLDRITATARTRVVFVTGRPARELTGLLNTRTPIEVWGSHGLERLLPNGNYFASDIQDRQTALASADARLESEGLGDLVEIKPGGIAVHWRGLAEAEVLEVRTRAYRVFRQYVLLNQFRLLDFDGGLELRVRSENKGDAVRAICAEIQEGAPVAYLGDDTTDEDAFASLRGRGLTVLVRPEYRDTSAELWLKPPDELMQFLARWVRCCGGDV